MIKIKQLAIFMDDTNALLMELYNHMIVSRNIVFRSRENEEYIDYSYSELFKRTDEQWHHWAYYKELGDIIRNYQQVVLFGPVGTKEGLYKLLEAEHHFKNTKIELVNTNIMTEFQIHDFVLEYYK